MSNESAKNYILKNMNTYSKEEINGGLKAAGISDKDIQESWNEVLNPQPQVQQQSQPKVQTPMTRKQLYQVIAIAIVALICIVAAIMMFTGKESTKEEEEPENAVFDLSYEYDNSKFNIILEDMKKINL